MNLTYYVRDMPVAHQRRASPMTINLTNETRFDTRGLPVGYDPHKLYEYRLDTLATNSSGLESFLYKLMPVSLVKSLAFAVDPTAAYKTSATRITPANRTRYRSTASVIQLRTYKKTRRFSRWYQDVNYKLVSICWSPYIIYDGSTTNLGTGAITTQPTLAARVKDTTKRTRLYGSDMGTFEKFKGYINSPPRKIIRRLSESSVYTSTTTNQPACGAVGGTYQFTSGSVDEYEELHGPTGATLSVNSYNQLRDGEINYCRSMCQKHAISMLKSVEPFAGDYTLFRNLVELRDIPRSILQLQKTTQDLRKVYLSLRHSPKTRKVVFNLKNLAKDVPNEYLSYHFGWKQLYNDVSDLLKLPEKTSKKVNFLIRRSGKPTTFRSKRKVSSATGTGVSGFDYSQTSYDYSLTTASRIEREGEVRLVVNRTFEFPPVNSVQFKQHVFAERIGLQPRITDLYNLTPWTWLLDWFTGLGNYIDLIETINSKDSGVVNWGMISCSTAGRLVTEANSLSTWSNDSRVNNSSSGAVESYPRNPHTSTFNFECQTRDDVSTILDLRLTSVPSTLTAYQMSILGALLTQRLNFRF